MTKMESDALKAELHDFHITLAAETEALRLKQHELKITLVGELAEIKTLLRTEAERCPYREDIARAKNNIKRMDDLVETVQNHRLETAKAAAGGGGVVAIAVLALQLLGKSLGWL